MVKKMNFSFFLFSYVKATFTPRVIWKSWFVNDKVKKISVNKKSKLFIEILFQKIYKETVGTCFKFF